MSFVPWITPWSGETAARAIQPCDMLGGKLGIFMPEMPGTGAPCWRYRHNVRSRAAVLNLLCNVCGEHTPLGDRWIFPVGSAASTAIFLKEPPAHRACAERAMSTCPFLAPHRCEPVQYDDDFGIMSLPISPDLLASVHGLPSPANRVVFDLGLYLMRDTFRRLFPAYFMPAVDRDVSTTVRSWINPNG